MQLPETTSRADGPYAVSAQELHFRYRPDGPPALDGLSLRVSEGERFVLLGPNGAGKSTLLSMVIGLRVAESGTLQVLGQPPGAPVRRQTAMLFQDRSLDLSMTVGETLMFYGGLHGLAGSALKERTNRSVEALGLGDRVRQPAGELSGGLRRRLELARAMLTEPRLLLLDEPTIGLDPDSRLHLWEELIALNNAGTTLLIATNDVAEADRYATRVAFIQGGKVLAEDSPAELKRGLCRDAVWVEAPGLSPEAVAEVARLPGVGGVKSVAPHLHVTVEDATSFIPQLFGLLGGRIHSVRVEASTLEDAYFDRVGVSITSPAEVSQS